MREKYSFYSYYLLKKKSINSVKSNKRTLHFLFNGILNKKFLNKAVTFLEPSEKVTNNTQNIQRIKTSGYFSIIKLNNKKLSKRPIQHIFILPNTILKKIYIYNQKQKIIPQAFLLQLFKSQIGYPKSFIQLNLALSSITRWYSDRGYQWAMIQMYHTKDSSSIIVNIDEGLISTIKMEYYTSSSEKLSKNLYTSVIEQYLGVKIGYPINTNYLQRKINYLKDNKLVGNIIYSIERSKNNLTYLDLVFQIQELKDKELLIIGENLYDNFYIVSFMTQLLKEYLIVSKFLITSNVDQLSPHRFKLYYFQTILNFQYNHNNKSEVINTLIYPFLKSSFQNFKFKYTKLKPLFDWTEETAIGCKLYLRNLNKANSYWILSMRSIKNIINLKLVYLNPSLKISKNFTIQMIIQVIKKTSSLNRYFSFIMLEKYQNYYPQFTTRYIFESLLTYNLTSYFSVSEKIVLSKHIQTKYFFKNQQNIDANSGITALLDINNHSLHRQSKFFCQKFITLWLKLYYQNFDTLNWATKGYFFKFESLYFTPLQKSYFFNSYLIHHKENLFFHKMNMKHILHLSLPTYFQNSMNHILSNTLKIQSNLSTETLSLLFYNSLFDNEIYKSFFNFSVKMKTEYLIPINEKSRISFFCNYLNPFFLNSSELTIVPQLNFGNDKKIDSLGTQLFYGLGIQLKLPINQIPPLSIEYTINSGRKFCIYLHISHQQ
uniref:hypothetical protein n=1 Tax=Bangia atropurpurea TaxID=31347 RepID=UPI001FCD7840|nr:hypothetical protein MW410_pgp125 [Bangia atropurpurea]UNJ18255.1 hypothetical protein [Bangia atropurpurea]